MVISSSKIPGPTARGNAQTHLSGGIAAVGVPFSKKSSFETHAIPVGFGGQLHAKCMTPKNGEVKRVVLIMPLVGGGAAQQLIQFRKLTKRGCRLVSFEYRGHGRSSGSFTLNRTAEDAAAALRWAETYAFEHGWPLHALATCYGVAPLLGALRDRPRPESIGTLVAVSGLVRLDYVIRLHEFALRLAFHLRLNRPLSVDEFLFMVRTGYLDRRSGCFRRAMCDYLSSLFPGLGVTRENFGQLLYDRVDFAGTLLQFHDPLLLDRVHVPASIPCHFFYGCRDDLFALTCPHNRLRYRRRVLELIPHALLHEKNINHFGQGPDHDHVIDDIAGIMEDHDRAAASNATPFVTQVA